jgi:biotin synthase
MHMQKTTAFLQRLTDNALAGKPAAAQDALRILGIDAQPDIVMLLSCANRVRQHFHGDAIDLCAIINARSGRCAEDCAFCAQSAHFATATAQYPLMSADEICSAAAACLGSHAHRFSIVTSGRGMQADQDFKRIRDVVERLAAMPGMLPCASLGILTAEQLAALRQAGLKRYHHNLETAGSFYGSICTTHPFQRRVETVLLAQQAGLEVCCGGILGLGETPQQRVELAVTLRDLKVDAVPLNFLNPIPGTPLGRMPLVPALDALKAIAMVRFVLPATELRVCGGREVSMRTLQPLMYLAGANGAMVGNYLTTAGRDPRADIQEIIDLGLTPLFQKATHP